MTKGGPGDQGSGVEGGEERIGEKKLRIYFTIVNEGRWERSKSIF